MKKRILSLLLAFLMAFSMIPGQTFAADGGEEPTETPTEAPDAHAAVLAEVDNTCCTMYNGIHDATCENYICPNCGTGPWHEVCPEIEEPPTETPTEPAKHPMIGKLVAATSSAGSYYEAPGENMHFVNNIYFADRMEIVAVGEKSGTTYYQLKASGCNWKADSLGNVLLYDGIWVKESYVVLLVYCEVCKDYNCGIDHSKPEDNCDKCDDPDCDGTGHVWCETCKKYDCGIDHSKPEDNCDKCDDPECDGTKHVKCEICGEYDCTDLHFWCDRCDTFDCGKPHLVCRACEGKVVDCDKTHKWCGLCGVYDCGESHERNEPTTAPILPSDRPALLPDEDVTVVDQYGDALTDGLYLMEGEQASVSAWANGDSNATYQWQIRYDSGSDLWVKITGQTQKGMLVSAAMFKSIIRTQGSTAIRCAMTIGEETLLSDEIPVHIIETPSAATFGARNGVIPLADEDDETGANLKTAYVVVQYLYFDGRTAASSEFASVIPGTAVNYSYTVPVIPGYKAVLKDASTLGSHASLANGILTVTYAEGELQPEQYAQIVVEYEPDYVAYTIIHYHQNVNNDNYTEVGREVVTVATDPARAHKTGEVITNAHKSYTGFYNLLYETPAAAADGSTVIEVYYDRYYYLMKFELSGGYGVDPIYARYEAPIPEGNPTRPGYALTHWTLDGNPTRIPANMPAGDRTYVAVWSSGDTTYDVVFWYENADNEKYAQAGIIEDVPVVSGTVVNGSDYRNTNFEGRDSTHFTYSHADENVTVNGDGSTIVNVYFSRNVYELTFEITNMAGSCTVPIHASHTDYTGSCYKLYCDKGHVHDDSCERALTCGFTNHEHTGSCMICTKPIHAEHTLDGCYQLNCNKTSHDHATAGCTLSCTHHMLSCYETENWYTIEETTKPQNLTANGNGIYTYTTDSIFNRQTHYYLYLNGTWYTSFGGFSGNKNDEQEITLDCNHSHGDSCYTCGKTNGTHTHSIANGCYDQICNLEIHTAHTEAAGCYKDTAHSHSEKCYTYQCGVLPHSHVEACYELVCDYLHYHSGSTCYLVVIRKYDADISDVWRENPVKAAIDAGDAFTWDQTNAQTAFMEKMPGVNSRMERYDYSGKYVYHWFYYLEVLPGMDTTGLTTRTDTDGKVYYQYDDTTLNYSGTGLVLTYDDDYYPITGFSQRYGKGENGWDYSNGNYRHSFTKEGDEYRAYLYYTRNKYNLTFSNYGEAVAGKGGTFYYQADISGQNFIPDEPADMEHGAYEFEGWYTSSFFGDTKFDFTTEDEDGKVINTTMPAEDIILFAKWVPVSRTIRFFLDKEDMEQGITIPERMAQIYADSHNGAVDPNSPYVKYETRTDVPNKSYIADPGQPGVSVGYEKHPYNGYTFLEWFYMEDGQERAFDPEEMFVSQDLDIYAKWTSNVMCKYNVYFALDMVNNETGAAGSDGIADIDANGNVIYIADPVSGSGIAAHTYTFYAKGGEELYNLGEDQNYQEGYFPNYGSHSITINAADTEGIGPNSYIFLYRPKEAVPYTVKYVNKQTGESLIPDRLVSDNKNVVVTENFAYIQGYMPDDYQKTLVVTAGGTNEIIFLYTKDEEHALYVVNYYIQELNSDLSHKGWAQYTNLQSTGDIGKTYSAEAINIAGFTLSASYTDGYNCAETINGMTGNNLPTTPISPLTDGKLSGKLSNKGMELNFYYTRNLYPYEFRYMLNGTTTKLADTELGIAGYDTNVTGVAKEIVKDLDGDGIYEDYRLYDPTETTKDIHIITDGEPLEPNAEVKEGDATVNVATFYYVRCTQTMTITKELLDRSAESDPDPNLEFEFSLLIHAKNGYHRNSYDYTKSDGTSGTLNYVISAPNTLKFTLKAGQTITIEGLPTAEYTLSELNLPTGYYNTDGTGVRNKLTVESQLDLTVTNTYGPANLILQKLVTKEYEGDTLPGGNFTFTVALAEKTAESYTYKLYDEKGQQVGDARTASVTNGVFTVTLEAGQYAVVPNMPMCGYTVSENVNTAVYNASYKVYVAESSNGASTGVTSGAASASGTGASVSGTFAAGKTDTVVFTNEYKRQLSSLTINKLVTGTGKQDTFIFHITGNGVDMDVTITGSGSVTICDLPLGSYTVTEDTDWSWRYSADKTSVSVDLKNNPDAEVTFTNTYSNNRWLDYAADMPNTFGGKKLRIRRR